MQIEGLADLTPAGSGGFSQVFRAIETQYNRTVAAKVLNFRLESTEDQVRFEQECHAMAQLSDHPNIVPLYSTTYTSEGYPVIIMEYFAGGTLATRVRQGVSERDVLDTGVKIASALHCAHQRGVTHRDVKPQNVLLSRFNEPALADFGISAIAQQKTVGASTGITLAYAAPEAIDGQSTARTDGYSLAASIYTVLAGQRPFDVPGTKLSSSDLVYRILKDEPPSLQQFGYSAEVDRTIRQRGMAKDTATRYPSAREFGEALRSLQNAQGFDPTPWTEASEFADPSLSFAVPADDRSITVVRPTAPDADLSTDLSASADGDDGAATASSTRRRNIAMIGAALALALVTFGALWASNRQDTSAPAIAPTTVAAPDNTYLAPIFAPADVTIERNGNGTAIVSWANPNEGVVEFEIERVDAGGIDLPVITTTERSIELEGIGDADAPCITMRTVGDRGQLSGDLAAPVCLSPQVGNEPVVAAVPRACAPGACDFRLDASGFFPGGMVAIVVEGPDGVDLNALFGTAYESRADVDADGDITWRFRPGNAAPLGTYRVTVVDNQSGLTSVTFFELIDS